MRISIHTIAYQLYILPFVTLTYDKTLNGNYEFIVGWMNMGIIFAFKPK